MWEGAKIPPKPLCRLLVLYKQIFKSITTLLIREDRKEEEVFSHLFLSLKCLTLIPAFSVTLLYSLLSNSSGNNKITISHCQH